MNSQKPKDCSCGFPKVQHTRDLGHATWCPAYARIAVKNQRKQEEQYEDWLRACKDEWGRSQAMDQEYVEPEFPG